MMTTSPFLRVKDVAERYGVAPGTIYSWTCKNRLPYLKLPGSRGLLFVPADLERFEAGAALEVKETQGGGKVVVPV